MQNYDGAVAPTLVPPTAVPPTAASSPFDALRKTRADGTEYWSARDLCPLMGYGAWREFTVPLKRAMRAAENTNTSLTSHFGVSPQVVNRPQGGGMPREDYELSRFACYLVAMNGDPNKSEVAAAQAYFAIRTREAEEGQETTAILSTVAQTLSVMTTFVGDQVRFNKHQEQVNENQAQVNENQAQINEEFRRQIREAARRPAMRRSGCQPSMSASRVPTVPTKDVARVLRNHGMWISQDELFLYLFEHSWAERVEHSWGGQSKPQPTSWAEGSGYLAPRNSNKTIGWTQFGVETYCRRHNVAVNVRARIMSDLFETVVAPVSVH